jgi:hypothetical protein
MAAVEEVMGASGMKVLVEGEVEKEGGREPSWEEEGGWA